MAKQIFMTRRIPARAEEMLREAGYDVTVSAKDGVLTRDELKAALAEKEYDAVASLLTDTVDADIISAMSQSVKIIANYAVGFNNIDVPAAHARGMVVTNTPDVLTSTVAEHTVALLLTLSSRIAEGDRFIREGKFVGWEPMLLLGTDLKGKTLGLVGAGRIGSEVAMVLHRGFGMNVFYSDVKQNEALEALCGAKFCATYEEVLAQADVVSIHVPLLPTTKHLINAERLATMKKNALLVNTSRGQVVDEQALVEALKAGTIRGAALDVFEFEPKVTQGLLELPNVVVNPHLASATEETRTKMAEMVATNIIEVLEGRTAPNAVV
ncbi:MAG: D-glycerate dehydrogenase [Candidatus Yonathbacteria bacterium]|nr:D-glycerate dehydrogenase [Candidatus Yonathbacteria bacterium]